jgi:hypothetical protein
MPGGVGGVEPDGSPLSRSLRCGAAELGVSPLGTVKPMPEQMD